MANSEYSVLLFYQILSQYTAVEIANHQLIYIRGLLKSGCYFVKLHIIKSQAHWTCMVAAIAVRFRNRTAENSCHSKETAAGIERLSLFRIMSY